MSLAPLHDPCTGKAPTMPVGKDFGLRSAEENEHGDGEADEACRFGEGEAEEQRAALAGGSRRIAQRPREIIAEDVFYTDAGTAESDGRDTRTDHLCCYNVHLISPVDWMG